MIYSLARATARNSRILTALSYKVRGIRPLDTLAALDEHLERSLGGAGDVTPEALERMGKAYLRIPADLRMPSDPFSSGYARAQRELYARIAGKAYDQANEATAFDFEAVKDSFFPYNTGSGPFVGSQLLSHGFVLKHVDLPRGARIVEFGAGWGNLTLHLALTGYRMTAVELNEPSIALMRHRAGLHGRSIEFVREDMGRFAATTTERFDGAIFLASFHHSDDHRLLVENLSRIVKDDGVVYFADEPIPPVSTPSLPYPWGLRLDAPSLYYVRRHGWLELGFNRGYFRALLARHGWDVRTVPSPIWGMGDLQIATRRKG